MTNIEKIKLLNEYAKVLLMSAIIILLPLCLLLIFNINFQNEVKLDLALIIFFFILKEVTEKIITKC